MVHLLIMAVMEVLQQWQCLRSLTQEISSAAAQVSVPSLQSIQLVLELKSLVSGDVLHQLQAGLHSGFYGLLLGGDFFCQFLEYEELFITMGFFHKCVEYLSLFFWL